MRTAHSVADSGRTPDAVRATYLPFGQPAFGDEEIAAVVEVLEGGGRIEIRGFGSFFTKSYGSYEGRNPRTGAKVMVSSKKLPHFRPSRELITKLNGGSE